MQQEQLGARNVRERRAKNQDWFCFKQVIRPRGKAEIGWSFKRTFFFPKWLPSQTGRFAQQHSPAEGWGIGALDPGQIQWKSLWSRKKKPNCFFLPHLQVLGDLWQSHSYFGWEENQMFWVFSSKQGWAARGKLSVGHGTRLKLWLLFGAKYWWGEISPQTRGIHCDPPKTRKKTWKIIFDTDCLAAFHGGNWNYLWSVSRMGISSSEGTEPRLLRGF